MTASVLHVPSHFIYTEYTCWMFRWPGDLANDNKRWLGFQMLMRFQGWFSSDDFEGITIDRRVVLLDSEVSNMLWPMWGSVG